VLNKNDILVHWSVIIVIVCYYMTVEVLMAVSMKIIVFWNVML
jgi:hypothetical protein